MVTIHKNERVDYLPNRALQIIQADDVFSFSIDAVLLAKFTYVPIQKGKMIDLCTGNGVIPFMLSTRSKATITGVEIQERLYDMAIRSNELNKRSDQIEFIHADINALPKEILGQQYDVVTCNPPYFEKKELSEQNVNPHLQIARHEIYCTLDDVVKTCAKLVRQKGKVALVHRPERLTDIFESMRKYRIEPKRIQFVQPKKNKEANIVLVEGIKDGKPGVKCLPTIVVYEDEKTYTKEFRAIYYG
ncbi:tRNA1(Val) (adenine(37)-N6)-methyltransferase [Alkalihalobacterium elongatum]|uniref:tRNA1(Val) (adenine(37)-N6)-methyltransferase n=1 Tax=Alkalihalobacterium elongatum TaxID=2675466 RepID=UPI001C1FECA6|nr:tRNA1(Val) (adenine(37)-N6)-methyltransferase [Alkalihalobacterium elongatum]